MAYWSTKLYMTKLIKLTTLNVGSVIIYIDYMIYTDDSREIKYDSRVTVLY